MNFKIVSVIAAVTAFVAQGAFAQAASAPTRADVKAETAAANKKGASTTSKEAVPMAKPDPKATKARADVKAETAAADKAGASTTSKEAVPMAKPDPKATKARADVKAETAAADKKGASTTSREVQASEPPVKK